MFAEHVSNKMYAEILRHTGHEIQLTSSPWMETVTFECTTCGESIYEYAYLPDLDIYDEEEEEPCGND